MLWVSRLDIPITCRTTWPCLLTVPVIHTPCTSHTDPALSRLAVVRRHMPGRPRLCIHRISMHHRKPLASRLVLTHGPPIQGRAKGQRELICLSTTFHMISLMLIWRLLSTHLATLSVPKYMLINSQGKAKVSVRVDFTPGCFRLPMLVSQLDAITNFQGLCLMIR